MEIENPVGGRSVDCQKETSKSFAEALQYASEGKRSNRLDTHLETGDYFALLATVVGSVEDVCRSHEEKGYVTAPATSVEFRKLRNELIYLHHNYDILPKETSKRE